LLVLNWVLTGEGAKYDFPVKGIERGGRFPYNLLVEQSDASGHEASRPAMRVAFRPGDAVIYRKQKYSLRPGPNAKIVCPAPYGDFYSYCVDKFWKVVSVDSPNQIVVCTRKGKKLTLSVDDPALRPARWWERLLFWRRFPAVNLPA
jgi:hypothetical protein